MRPPAKTLHLRNKRLPRTNALSYNFGMLNPTQVLPFLIHPEPDVREHAAKYFTDLEDAAPIETADALWTAIDRFGEHRTELGTKQRQRFLHALAQVPLNQASVIRAISLLGTCASDADCVFALNLIFEKLPLDLVEKQRDEILPLLKPQFRDSLEHRLSLTLLSPEELWRQFEALAQKAMDAEDSRGIDSDAGSRFVEALARHPDFAIPLATAVLENPDDRWWLETWCAELLGHMRHAPSIDLMIEKLKLKDADILRQNAGIALSRMPVEIVVPKLEAAYPSDDPFDRMSVAESLAKLKHPLAEAALIRLLTNEDNESATTNLCTALCDLVTTDGLESLRQVVIDDRYDSTIADVKELFITVSTMAGFAPPELEQLKKQVADPVYRRQLRSKFLESFGLDKKMAERFRELLSSATLDEPDEASSVKTLLPPRQSTMPYRREQPKVGRNDPCPCGSGKKYKKCCGK